MSKSSLVNAIKRLILTLVFILTLSLPSWSQHTTWNGKVVGVSDGDTITVMHDGMAEKIRPWAPVILIAFVTWLSRT